jgi:hemoglobin
VAKRRASPKATGRSLYDRLGGIYAIAAVVNHFSDAVIANPLVGRDSPNAQLRAWSRTKRDRLPGLKWLRTLWVAAVSGGPYEYVGTRPGKCPFGLEAAHRALKITPAEFAEVAGELRRSLDHFRVPQREQREVLAAFAAHQPEITSARPVCPKAKR